MWSVDGPVFTELVPALSRVQSKSSVLLWVKPSVDVWKSARASPHGLRPQHDWPKPKSSMAMSPVKLVPTIPSKMMKNVPVTLAMFAEALDHLLPWFPDLVQTVKLRPDNASLTYTLRVPVVEPYMWYQNSTVQPTTVDEYGGEVRRAV